MKNEIELLTNEKILTDYFNLIKNNLEHNILVTKIDYKLAKIAQKMANPFEVSPNYVSRAGDLLRERAEEVKEIHQKIYLSIREVFFLRISASHSYYTTDDSEIAPDDFLDSK